MKNVTLLLLLAVSACSSPQRAHQHASLESNEGFYELNQIPKLFPGVKNSDTIKAIKLSTGASFSPESSKFLDKKNYEKEYQNICQKNSKKWNEQLCLSLDVCRKTNVPKCKIKNHKKIICAGALLESDGGHFFVTSYHCSKHPRIKKDMFVRFFENFNSEKIIDRKITPIQADQSAHPFGLFVYKIHNWPKERKTAQFSDEKLQESEPVIHAGFPRPEPARTVFSGTYSRKPNGLRASIGKITNPNNKARSFCLFTVNLGMTDHESWKLEKDCPTRSELMKNKNYASVLNTPYAFAFPREERDPFLANTDMINGMSGGPLFNHKGLIIGIGSTVLKNSPPLNYSPKYPASFSKVKHFKSMIK